MEGRATTKKRSRSKSLVRSRKKRQRWEQQQQNAGNGYYETTFAPRTRTTFEDYVATENFLAGNEHGIFLRCLRTPLPITFRIRNAETQNEFKHLWKNMMASSSQLSHIRQVASSGDTYQISQEDYDSNYDLKRWSSLQTKLGTVSRQELVSMIPVWLLNIQSHHRILDMCASPGSKTIQAVDALYNSDYEKSESGTSSNNKSNSALPPTGFVIANEIDPKRSYVLAHRCKTTLKEKQVSIAIVGHNATKFPNVLAPLSRNGDGDSSMESPSQSLLYDRIICDVPCSGDGNQRRDQKVFKTWHPTYGIALHTLQLRIAKRAIALLKIGGVMTYSTCSFHPIENEAVVSALLATKTVELIDPTPLLYKVAPQLVIRSGLSYWKVYNDDMKEIEQPFQEANGDRKRPNKNNHDEITKLPSTLWPPTSTNDGTSITRELSKCIRMVPHDNDAGGFFIAVLKKIRDYPTPTATTTKKKKKASPLITPKGPHHSLYPLTSTTECRVTSTLHKPTNTVGLKRSDTGRRVFAVSNGLVQHLCNEIGSDKLNIVYAGYDITKERSKTTTNS